MLSGTSGSLANRIVKSSTPTPPIPSPYLGEFSCCRHLVSLEPQV